MTSGEVMLELKDADVHAHVRVAAVSKALTYWHCPGEPTLYEWVKLLNLYVDPRMAEALVLAVEPNDP